MSTLLSLPDDRRAEVERLLVPLARSAALGELAAGVAHDVANPLFGAIGLVDLLLEDAAPGSEAAAHLRLLKESTLDMKGTLQVLLEFGRGADGRGHGTLDEALDSALRLLGHGGRHTVTVADRHEQDAALVPCPPDDLVQVVLQLLLAARGVPGAVVEVAGARLSISPAPPETLGTLVAARIVVDHGGRLEQDEGSLRVEF